MFIQSTPTNIESSNKNSPQKFWWREYLILVFAGLIGVMAALPSAWIVLEKTSALSKVPTRLLATGKLIQSTFWMFFAVAVGVGLFLAGEQVGAKFRSQILPSALDRLFFIPRMPGFSSAISQISGWKGKLASLYGGITEEILTRLFFLTLLSWILSRFSHTDKGSHPGLPCGSRSCAQPYFLVWDICLPRWRPHHFQ